VNGELEFADLVGVLVTHEVKFVTIGGIAVLAHGKMRATEDVDVVPAPHRENLQRLLDALGEAEAHVPGADPMHDPLTIQALTSGASVKCETRFGPLHIVQAQPGMPSFDELSDSAIEVEVGGHPMLVCSYEHLVQMKRAADRPQDRIDIADLEAAREEDD
jgi:hypothetical protein